MPGVSDGLGSRNRVRKKSPLFCWSRGKIKSAELSRWHPCWCIVALGTRALQKTSLVFSAWHCTITWGQKGTGVAFRECSALHYQRRMIPIFPESESSGFWYLVILREQGLECSPSKFGSSKGRTAEGVAKILRKVIRDSCKAVSKRFQLVIDPDDGHIAWCFGNCLSNFILHKYICKNSQFYFIS